METFTLVGSPGSPYSRKLRAVLRYRRIPTLWINQGSPESHGLPQPKVALAPRLVLDGEARTDTTPLIRELERRVPNQRSVIPTDPAIAFLDSLIEDYGDEWLTKAMFHYRWAYEADILKAKTILPRWFSMTLSNEELDRAGDDFAKRQIDRLWVVGSNETTGPIIEASYERFLEIFDDHLGNHRFLLGARPGTGDFGIYGQLTQLAGFDPTALETTLAHGPRVAAHMDLVEDLSGMQCEDDQWFERDELPGTLHALFGEIGRVYAPFLLANAVALESGSDRVECEIDGAPWTQKPFPYQGKCLAWLREGYAQLASADRGFVDDTLEGTGCEALFAA